MLGFVALWLILFQALDPCGFDETRDTYTLLAQMTAGILVGIGLYLTYQRILAADRTAQAALQSVELARAGQIADRFTKAIEHLGTNTPAVRLGGIYALEKIARHSSEDHWTVIEVLTAFIRDKMSWDDEREQKNRQETQVTAEIQAALTVIGRRSKTYKNGEHERLDLHATNLRGASLREARLEGANLIDTHLEGADLRGAQLEGAFLDKARLGILVLAQGGPRRKTNLTLANMKDVKCGSADLHGAVLAEADLSGASFVHSNFTGANLTKANLENADLSEATLSEATLSGATLHRTRINGANLERVAGLIENQLKSALGDEQTKLPPERERPAHW